MGQISFLGPTYQSRSPNIAADRSVNFYPEINPADAKSVIALVGTPGTTLFATPSASPIRGMHVYNDVLYVVVGSNLYSVSINGAISASLGTLTTSSGPVYMANNGVKSLGVGGDQLAIVDGAHLYIYNISTTAFTQLLGVSGSHKSGYTTSAFYVDSLSRNMATLGAVVGQTIFNNTDLSSGVITAIGNADATNDKIEATLAGGFANVWNTSNGMDIYGGGIPTNPNFVAYLDGYFIVTNGTMSFWVSDLYNGLRWRPLATASVIAVNDIIKGIATLHQQVWFIKEYSSEVWYDASIATAEGSPFLRVSGAVIDYGTAAPGSIAHGANSIFFLASERNETFGAFVGVVQLSGYTPTVISTYAINYRISQLAGASTGHADAVGYCYSEGGHTFYVLTFPTGNATFVYDTTTMLWHERSTTIISGLTLYFDDSINFISTYRVTNTLTSNMYAVNRHLGQYYAFFNHKHYISHYATGGIYEMSSRYLRDDVLPIIAQRVAQHTFDKNDLNNIMIHKLQIDAETGNIVVTNILTASAGFPADGTYYADGSIYAGSEEIPYTVADPQAVLSWSDDGGHTWSNDYSISFGTAQQYKKRLIWRRLGVSRDRVFRFLISDAVQRTITGAYAEVTA